MKPANLIFPDNMFAKPRVFFILAGVLSEFIFLSSKIAGVNVFSLS